MDLIYAGRYTEVCDYAWDQYKNPQGVIPDLPSGIWHVDTASIPDFFMTIQNSYNRKRKYVVVSPSCDFCVCLQKYNHPVFDFEKWIGLQANITHGYNDLHMQARINRENCTETDKYSIKCWSYTQATFPIIPPNVVRWFLANCDIQDERVIPLPFGIEGNKNNLEHAHYINKHRQIAKERTKLLYINFQFYTTDRAKLYAFFDVYENVGVTCKHQVPFEEYIEDLATHKYVLCPPGNGWDCYRTLETIYMGAIPILEYRYATIIPYMNVQYPIVSTKNLFSVHLGELEQSYPYLMEKYENKINLTQVSWSYWKDRILSARNLMAK